MCDDRITDGQQVQIDQCLYCTRFEPVFGQVYELLNDTGMNVAAILDDNQMSYRDMKDFVANARYEKFMTEHDKTNVPATKAEVETRSQNEYSFKDRWGAGIAMDWTYVPKEEQKCHINWRQSINDDGSKIGRLGSWPYMYDRPNLQGKNGGSSGGKNGSNPTSDSMKKNVDSMNGYTNIEPEQKGKVEAAIAAGKAAAEEAQGDDVKNRVCCDWQSQILENIKGKTGMDTPTIASLMYCTGSEDVKGTIDKYDQAIKDVGTQNPAVVVPAFAYGKEVILGNGKDIKPIWEVPLYKPQEQDSDSGSGSGSGNHNSDSGSESGSGSGGKTRPTAEKLDKGQIDSWLYGDALYVERLAKQVSGDINLFPRVANTYVALEPLMTSSAYDNGENVFPFTYDTLSNVEVYYTSPYGTRTLDGETKLHRGVDLGAPGGTEFVAVHDGTITAAGDGWGSDDNAICLDHGNGQYSRYLHCSEILCSTGQQVKAGEVIGKVGNVGHSFGDHLHFEFSNGVSNETYSETDPLSFYSKFNVAVGDRIPAEAAAPSDYKPSIDDTSSGSSGKTSEGTGVLSSSGTKTNSKSSGANSQDAEDAKQKIALYTEQRNMLIEEGKDGYQGTLHTKEEIVGIAKNVVPPKIGFYASGSYFQDFVGSDYTLDFVRRRIILYLGQIISGYQRIVNGTASSTDIQGI